MTDLECALLNFKYNVKHQKDSRRQFSVAIYSNYASTRKIAFRRFRGFINRLKMHFGVILASMDHFQRVESKKRDRRLRDGLAALFENLPRNQMTKASIFYQRQLLVKSFGAWVYCVHDGQSLSREYERRSLDYSTKKTARRFFLNIQNFKLVSKKRVNQFQMALVFSAFIWCKYCFQIWRQWASGSSFRRQVCRSSALKGFGARQNYLLILFRRWKFKVHAQCRRWKSIFSYKRDSIQNAFGSLRTFFNQSRKFAAVVADAIFYLRKRRKLSHLKKWISFRNARVRRKTRSIILTPRNQQNQNSGSISPLFSFEANYDVHMKKQGNCKDDYRNLLLGDASQSQSGVYPFAEVRLHVPITSSMCSSAIRRLRNTRRALRHLRCNHHQKELCREQLQKLSNICKNKQKLYAIRIIRQHVYCRRSLVHRMSRCDARINARQLRTALLILLRRVKLTWLAIPRKTALDRHLKTSYRFWRLLSGFSSIQLFRERLVTQASCNASTVAYHRVKLLTRGFYLLRHYMELLRKHRKSALNGHFVLERKLGLLGLRTLSSRCECMQRCHYAILQATVFWKVWRYSRAVRAWWQFVQWRRQHRYQLRQAHIDFRTSAIREGCKMWMQAASRFIGAETEKRISNLSRRVVAKWRSFVLKRRLLRFRQDDPFHWNKDDFSTPAHVDTGNTSYAHEPEATVPAPAPMDAIGIMARARPRSLAPELDTPLMFKPFKGPPPQFLDMASYGPVSAVGGLSIRSVGTQRYGGEYSHTGDSCDADPPRSSLTSEQAINRGFSRGLTYDWNCMPMSPDVGTLCNVSEYSAKLSTTSAAFHSSTSAECDSERTLTLNSDTGGADIMHECSESALASCEINTFRRGHSSAVESLESDIHSAPSPVLTVRQRRQQEKRAKLAGEIIIFVEELKKIHPYHSSSPKNI